VITIPLKGQLPGPIAFSPDGTLLGLRGREMSLCIYDTFTGNLLWSTPESALPGGYSDGPVSFSPDNRYVIRNLIPSEVFEVKTGKRVPSLPDKKKPGSKSWPGPFLEPEIEVRALSPDGKWAAGSDEMDEPDLKFQNRTKNEWINLFPYMGKVEGSKNKVPLWAIVPFTFSPDNSLLACGDHSRLHILRVEELAHLKPVDDRRPEINVPLVPIVVTLKLPRKHFQGAAFTTDGKRLLTISNEATVRVWETTSWKECHAYEWEAGPLRSITMSNDGTRAAVAGTKKIVIWDLDD
jgi:WD40 repeat protein